MEESKIKQFIGMRIKLYRKMNNYTLITLAEKLKKSKSTISKYENGEISIDITTLYEIAKIFDVSIDNFLYHADKNSALLPDKIGTDFNPTQILYICHWDGRPKRNKYLYSAIELDTTSSKCLLYWNVKDSYNYAKCDYMFYGRLLKSETSRRFVMLNTVSEMDMVIINYLDPLISRNVIIQGNVSSHSVGQFECYATKCIISDKPLNMTNEIIAEIMISKVAQNELKKTNVFRMNLL